MLLWFIQVTLKESNVSAHQTRSFSRRTSTLPSSKRSKSSTDSVRSSASTPEPRRLGIPSQMACLSSATVCELVVTENHARTGGKGGLDEMRTRILYFEGRAVGRISSTSKSLTHGPFSRVKRSRAVKRQPLRPLTTTTQSHRAHDLIQGRFRKRTGSI